MQETPISNKEMPEIDKKCDCFSYCGRLSPDAKSFICALCKKEQIIDNKK